MNNFTNEATHEQTVIIAELIGDSPNAPYTLSDLFNVVLPKRITINGRTGDLFISTYDISYLSVEPNWKINLIKAVNFYPTGNVFDAAIEMLDYINLYTKQ